MTDSAALSRPSGVTRAARVRACLAVVLGLTLSGVLAGALWAWIAPPLHAVVAITRAGERVHDYLGNESEHFFVAPFLMLALLGVISVVAPVLVWQWRQHRGPGMVVVLCIGLVLAAAVAVTVGALLVRLRYGALDFDTVPLVGERAVAYVVEAPPVFFARGPLQVATTLFWPVGIASLVCVLLVAANARDDLGGLPAVTPRPSVLPAAPPGSPGPQAPEAPEAPEAVVS
ncbi:MAG: DUF2567 domain-containing protein [Mycobacterium sp.]|uniref:DUF2567 domain-containing protein n=1 Tax=Mycobacterium sp. TaxID=1785 RepID=UPI001ED2732A|nr:DUF2567 domain-containing protein [Mycobacterium sp.]MBW0020016.1 DUF2567 domain-containing protein [Mycobacterium sp.]